ncbi:phospho-N-acetylmuramoyl-pentapeptide-transferase [candidate division KSB1 bacterium]|nr:phospho-N-acetylmuramoyl-pentapeptide-transferase [candidate division KSB1 bacterium]
MLFMLGKMLEKYYGPFRLFQSHLFLAGIGLIACWLLTWWLLPKLARRLPRDRGRAFAVQSEVSVGKPTGTGLIFVSIFVLVGLLVVPFGLQAVLIFGCILIAMFFGFWDDHSKLAWGEYKKGAIDLLLAVVTASVLCWFKDFPIWLPFTKATFLVPPVIFIPGATILLWTAVNATNCTDGIDGLSGTLAVLALTILGALLYFVVGHKTMAGYLLLPHYPEGAKWAIMAFSMVGSLAGYLWFNAHPSSLLMGDAGSRALGLLIGVLVICAGNPFIIFIVAGVLLVNGGTGLIKVTLLRFFKIGIFRKIRFPLHDHFRHNAGWSNTQVLIRFAVLQAMLTLILIVLLIKIR